MMISLIELLDTTDLYALKLISKKKTLFSCMSDEVESQTDVSFEGKMIGSVGSNLKGLAHSEVVEQLSTLLILLEEGYKWEEVVALQTWVKGARDLVKNVTDWIGVYYKANYFLKEDTTDLILGPYYGESTSHKRIPLERGLCGLALRDERVVNVDDISKDDRHIACSLKTKSELIIPLKNKQGEFIAELDIDCNRLGAFSPEIESKFIDYCRDFANHWEIK